MSSLRFAARFVGRAIGVAASFLRGPAGLLALLWGPAAVFLVSARIRPIGCTEVRLAAAALLAWLLLRAASRRTPDRFGPWLRAAVAVPVALAVLAAYGGWIKDRDQSVKLPGTDLWVPAHGQSPGSATNEFLMRGAPGRDRPAGTPVVALIGCSMILGAGVGDSDAPDVWLERTLRETFATDVRVFDFALSAGGAKQMTSLVAYAVDRLHPDLVIVYFPGHHVMPGVDFEERTALLDGSFGYRLLAATLYEPLVPLFQSIRLRLGDPSATPRPEVNLIAGMDGFHAAAAGTPLVIVTDVRDGSHRPPHLAFAPSPAVRGAIARWAEAHRGDAKVIDVSDDPAWQAAATQPDHHWTAEGIRTTMAILAEYVSGLFHDEGNGTTRVAMPVTPPNDG